ncbi:MAG: DUF6898 family protein [Solirubrobacterales bacterium]
MTGREVYFEFRRIGSAVKVVAIDSLTGTEVSIVGAVSAGEAQLKATALRKLQFVLDKNRR